MSVDGVGVAPAAHDFVEVEGAARGDGGCGHGGPRERGFSEADALAAARPGAVLAELGLREALGGKVALAGGADAVGAGAGAGGADGRGLAALGGVEFPVGILGEFALDADERGHG